MQCRGEEEKGKEVKKAQTLGGDGRRGREKDDTGRETHTDRGVQAET